MAITINTKAGAKVLTLKKAKGSKYAPKTDVKKFLEVLQHVQRGDSLAQACKRPGMPSEATFHRWKSSDGKHDVLYREALSYQVDGLVDGVLPMLDTLFHGQKVVSESGKLRRASMRIQHIQWMASRRDPEHYGAKVAGDDGVVKLINSPDDDEGNPYGKSDAKDATKKVS